MNIIYLGNNDPRIFKRGVENVILAQSQGFTQGLKYYIFFGERNEVFRWEDIICISIKKNWKKYILLNLIIRRLKKKNKSLIHSHGPVRTLFCLYTTDILTVHDAIYYQRKGLQQRFYKIFYFIEKIAYSKSKKIHFISHYALSQSLYIPSKKNKAIIIYNTTPLESLLNSEVDIKNSPQSDDSSFTILAVRGIQKRTRIDLLIDFADYCKDKKLFGKKIILTVAGKGDLLNYYREKIRVKNLTNINLIGFVPDKELVNLYRSCDCVILTCDHAEGFGLPIIEGYCCNKPVIGSNKCAVPEIIIDKKFLFENDPQDIYRILGKVFEQNLDYKKYYNDMFSLGNYKKQFNNLYSQFQ